MHRTTNDGHRASSPQQPSISNNTLMTTPTTSPEKQQARAPPSSSPGAGLPTLARRPSRRRLDLREVPPPTEDHQHRWGSIGSQTAKSPLVASAAVLESERLRRIKNKPQEPSSDDIEESTKQPFVSESNNNSLPKHSERSAFDDQLTSGAIEEQHYVAQQGTTTAAQAPSPSSPDDDGLWDESEADNQSEWMSSPAAQYVAAVVNSDDSSSQQKDPSWFSEYVANFHQGEDEIPLRSSSESTKIRSKPSLLDPSYNHNSIGNLSFVSNATSIGAVSGASDSHQRPRYIRQTSYRRNSMGNLSEQERSGGGGGDQSTASDLAFRRLPPWFAAAYNRNSLGNLSAVSVASGASVASDPTNAGYPSGHSRSERSGGDSGHSGHRRRALSPGRRLSNSSFVRELLAKKDRFLKPVALPSESSFGEDGFDAESYDDQSSGVQSKGGRSLKDRFHAAASPGTAKKWSLNNLSALPQDPSYQFGQGRDQPSTSESTFSKLAGLSLVNSVTTEGLLPQHRQPQRNRSDRSLLSDFSDVPSFLASSMKATRPNEVAHPFNRSQKSLQSDYSSAATYNASAHSAPFPSTSQPTPFPHEPSSSLLNPTTRGDVDNRTASAPQPFPVQARTPDAAQVHPAYDFIEDDSESYSRPWAESPQHSYLEMDSESPDQVRIKQQPFRRDNFTASHQWTSTNPVDVTYHGANAGYLPQNEVNDTGLDTRNFNNPAIGHSPLSPAGAFLDQGEVDGSDDGQAESVSSSHYFRQSLSPARDQQRPFYAGFRGEETEEFSSAGDTVSHSSFRQLWDPHTGEREQGLSGDKWGDRDDSGRQSLERDIHTIPELGSEAEMESSAALSHRESPFRSWHSQDPRERLPDFDDSPPDGSQPKLQQEIPTDAGQSPHDAAADFDKTHSLHASLHSLVSFVHASDAGDSSLHKRDVESAASSEIVRQNTSGDERSKSPQSYFGNRSAHSGEKNMNTADWRADDNRYDGSVVGADDLSQSTASWMDFNQGRTSPHHGVDTETSRPKSHGGSGCDERSRSPRSWVESRIIGSAHQDENSETDNLSEPSWAMRRSIGKVTPTVNASNRVAGDDQMSDVVSASLRSWQARSPGAPEDDDLASLHFFDEKGLEPVLSHFEAAHLSSPIQEVLSSYEVPADDDVREVAGSEIGTRSDHDSDDCVSWSSGRKFTTVVAASKKEPDVELAGEGFGGSESVRLSTPSRRFNLSAEKHDLLKSELREFEQHSTAIMSSAVTESAAETGGSFHSHKSGEILFAETVSQSKDIEISQQMQANDLIDKDFQLKALDDLQRVEGQAIVDDASSSEHTDLIDTGAVLGKVVVVDVDSNEDRLGRQDAITSNLRSNKIQSTAAQERLVESVVAGRQGEIESDVVKEDLIETAGKSLQSSKSWDDDRVNSKQFSPGNEIGVSEIAVMKSNQDPTNQPGQLNLPTSPSSINTPVSALKLHLTSAQLRLQKILPEHQVSHDFERVVGDETSDEHEGASHDASGVDLPPATEEEVSRDYSQTVATHTLPHIIDSENHDIMDGTSVLSGDLSIPSQREKDSTKLADEVTIYSEDQGFIWDQATRLMVDERGIADNANRLAPYREPVMQGAIDASHVADETRSSISYQPFEEIPDEDVMSSGNIDDYLPASLSSSCTPSSVPNLQLSFAPIRLQSAVPEYELPNGLEPPVDDDSVATVAEPLLNETNLLPGHGSSANLPTSQITVPESLIITTAMNQLIDFNRSIASADIVTESLAASADDGSISWRANEGMQGEPVLMYDGGREAGQDAQFVINERQEVADYITETHCSHSAPREVSSALTVMDVSNPSAGYTPRSPQSRSCGQLVKDVSETISTSLQNADADFELPASPSSSCSPESAVKFRLSGNNIRMQGVVPDYEVDRDFDPQLGDESVADPTNIEEAADVHDPPLSTRSWDDDAETSATGNPSAVVHYLPRGSSSSNDEPGFSILPEVVSTRPWAAQGEISNRGNTDPSAHLDEFSSFASESWRSKILDEEPGIFYGDNDDVLKPVSEHNVPDLDGRTDYLRLGNLSRPAVPRTNVIDADASNSLQSWKSDRSSGDSPPVSPSSSFTPPSALAFQLSGAHVTLQNALPEYEVPVDFEGQLGDESDSGLEQKETSNKRDGLSLSHSWPEEKEGETNEIESQIARQRFAYEFAESDEKGVTNDASVLSQNIPAHSTALLLKAERRADAPVQVDEASSFASDSWRSNERAGVEQGIFNHYCSDTTDQNVHVPVDDQTSIPYNEADPDSTHSERSWTPGLHNGSVLTADNMSHSRSGRSNENDFWATLSEERSRLSEPASPTSMGSPASSMKIQLSGKQLKMQIAMPKYEVPDEFEPLIGDKSIAGLIDADTSKLKGGEDPRLSTRSWCEEDWHEGSPKLLPNIDGSAGGVAEGSSVLSKDFSSQSRPPTQQGRSSSNAFDSAHVEEVSSFASDSWRFDGRTITDKCIAENCIERVERGHHKFFSSQAGDQGIDQYTSECEALPSEARTLASKCASVGEMSHSTRSWTSGQSIKTDRDWASLGTHTADHCPSTSSSVTPFSAVNVQLSGAKVRLQCAVPEYQLPREFDHLGDVMDRTSTSLSLPEDAPPLSTRSWGEDDISKLGNRNVSEPAAPDGSQKNYRTGDCTTVLSDEGSERMLTSEGDTNHRNTYGLPANLDDVSSFASKSWLSTEHAVKEVRAFEHFADAVEQENSESFTDQLLDDRSRYTEEAPDTKPTPDDMSHSIDSWRSNQSAKHIRRNDASSLTPLSSSSSRSPASALKIQLAGADLKLLNNVPEYEMTSYVNPQIGDESIVGTEENEVYIKGYGAPMSVSSLVENDVVSANGSQRSTHKSVPPVNSLLYHRSAGSTFFEDITAQSWAVKGKADRSTGLSVSARVDEAVSTFDSRSNMREPSTADHDNVTVEREPREAGDTSPSLSTCSVERSALVATHDELELSHRNVDRKSLSMQSLISRHPVEITNVPATPTSSCTPTSALRVQLADRSVRLQSAVPSYEVPDDFERKIEDESVANEGMASAHESGVVHLAARSRYEEYDTAESNDASSSPEHRQDDDYFAIAEGGNALSKDFSAHSWANTAGADCVAYSTVPAQLDEVSSFASESWRSHVVETETVVEQIDRKTSNKTSLEAPTVEHVENDEYVQRSTYSGSASQLEPVIEPTRCWAIAPRVVVDEREIRRADADSALSDASSMQSWATKHEAELRTEQSPFAFPSRSHFTEAAEEESYVNAASSNGDSVNDRNARPTFAVARDTSKNTARLDQSLLSVTSWEPQAIERCGQDVSAVSQLATSPSMSRPIIGVSTIESDNDLLNSAETNAHQDSEILSWRQRADNAGNDGDQNQNNSQSATNADGDETKPLSKIPTDKTYQTIFVSTNEKLLDSRGMGVVNSSVSLLPADHESSITSFSKHGDDSVLSRKLASRSTLLGVDRDPQIDDTNDLMEESRRVAVSELSDFQARGSEHHVVREKSPSSPFMGRKVQGSTFDSKSFASEEESMRSWAPDTNENYPASQSRELDASGRQKAVESSEPDCLSVSAKSWVAERSIPPGTAQADFLGSDIEHRYADIENHGSSCSQSTKTGQNQFDASTHSHEGESLDARNNEYQESLRSSNSFRSENQTNSDSRSSDVTPGSLHRSGYDGPLRNDNGSATSSKGSWYSASADAKLDAGAGTGTDDGKESWHSGADDFSSQSPSSWQAGAQPRAVYSESVHKVAKSLSSSPLSSNAPSSAPPFAVSRPQQRHQHALPVYEIPSGLTATVEGSTDRLVTPGFRDEMSEMFLPCAADDGNKAFRSQQHGETVSVTDGASVASEEVSMRSWGVWNQNLTNETSNVLDSSDPFEFSGRENAEKQHAVGNIDDSEVFGRRALAFGSHGVDETYPEDEPVNSQDLEILCISNDEACATASSDVQQQDQPKDLTNKNSAIKLSSPLKNPENVGESWLGDVPGFSSEHYGVVATEQVFEAVETSEIKAESQGKISTATPGGIQQPMKAIAAEPSQATGHRERISRSQSGHSRASFDDDSDLSGFEQDPFFYAVRRTVEHSGSLSTPETTEPIDATSKFQEAEPKRTDSTKFKTDETPRQSPSSSTGSKGVRPEVDEKRCSLKMMERNSAIEDRRLQPGNERSQFVTNSFIVTEEQSILSKTFDEEGERSQQSKTDSKRSVVSKSVSSRRSSPSDSRSKHSDIVVSERSSGRTSGRERSVYSESGGSSSSGSRSSGSEFTRSEDERSRNSYHSTASYSRSSSYSGSSRSGSYSSRSVSDPSESRSGSKRYRRPTKLYDEDLIGNDRLPGDGRRNGVRPPTVIDALGFGASPGDNLRAVSHDDQDDESSALDIRDKKARPLITDVHPFDSDILFDQNNYIFNSGHSRDEESGLRADDSPPVRTSGMHAPLSKRGRLITLLVIGCIATAFIIALSVALSGKSGGVVTLGPPTTAPSSNLPTASPTAVSFGMKNWKQLGNPLVGDILRDQAGFSVSLSDDGTIVAVGARRASPGGNQNEGVVKVYQLSDSGNWTQIAQLEGEGQGDHFGFSVSLSGNGFRLAVGSIGASDNGIDSGRVSLFEMRSNTFVQVGTLLGEGFGDVFGVSVSLSSDGNMLAVGAPQHTSSGTFQSGKVYFYEVAGFGSTTWTSTRPSIAGVSLQGYFGWSVSLSGDGSRLAIGAPFFSGDTADSGYVEVYGFFSGSWRQLGSDISSGNPGDRFGYSVSFSEDGSRLGIGAYRIGKAFVYEFSASSSLRGSTWKLVGAPLEGLPESSNFGYSVGLSVDGNYVGVGAPTYNATTGTGLARFYKFSSSDWTASHDVVADVDGGLGFSLSLAANASMIAVGLPFANEARVYN